MEPVGNVAFAGADHHASGGLETAEAEDAAVGFAAWATDAAAPEVEASYSLEYGSDAAAYAAVVHEDEHEDDTPVWQAPPGVQPAPLSCVAAALIAHRSNPRPSPAGERRVDSRLGRLQNAESELFSPDGRASDLASPDELQPPPSPLTRRLASETHAPLVTPSPRVARPPLGSP